MKKKTMRRRLEELRRLTLEVDDAEMAPPRGLIDIGWDEGHREGWSAAMEAVTDILNGEYDHDAPAVPCPLGCYTTCEGVYGCVRETGR